MSVLGPSIIKQQLQYLSDEDDETAGEIATDILKVNHFVSKCLILNMLLRSVIIRPRLPSL